jgi:hypothetical protein
VARYCKPSAFHEGRPTVAHFLLRQEIQETYLSVNCLEALPGADHAARVVSMRAEVAKSGFRASKNAKYAILGVGSTRKLVHERAADGRWIRVTTETEGGFPAYHAGIHDTAADEMLIAQAIVDSVIALEPAA